MALMFAYELGFERFLYRNRSSRRDKDNPCRNISHMSQSWVRNQLNSVLNIKSEYFKHNFGLQMRSDGDDPNFKDVYIDNTELFYVDHFFI